MNKILTGKCWKLFTAWYATNYKHKGVEHSSFLFLPFAMKYGVYVQFFESKRIYIGKDGTEIDTYWVCQYKESSEKQYLGLTQRLAIQKANEIINSNE